LRKTFEIFYEKYVKMALLDPNCSPYEGEFGPIFYRPKNRPKSRHFSGDFIFLKSPSSIKSRPIGEKSPNSGHPGRKRVKPLTPVHFYDINM
jgi:hypothetical protein